MKKALYVTRIIKGKNHIFNKIQAQSKGLEKLGYNVDLCWVNSDHKICINNREIGNLDDNYQLQINFFNLVSKFTKGINYDLIYIRNPFIINQFSFLRFLKNNRNTDNKILLEIPTYPYYMEMINLKRKAVYFFEQMFKGQYKKYIDCILYSGNNFEKIYGIKAIQLYNIGDIDEIRMKKESHDFDNKITKLIGVSGCSIYHGYDRVIIGLRDYYKIKEADTSLKDVEFHIVGDGPFLAYYKELVEKNNLKEQVIFYGSKYKDELDSIYDEKNIGVSCIGMHRIGLKNGSPLKTGEYGSRGLPVVLGYHDELFSNRDFAYQIEGNDSPVNITDLLKWYDESSFTTESIREFTLENVSWKKQFENIIKRLK